MKKLLVATTITALFAASNMAFAESVKCPKDSDIQQRSVGVVFEDKDGIDGDKGSFASFTLGNFNTPRFWHFTISNIDGKDRDSAYVNASQALPHLKNVNFSTVKDSEGNDICKYTIGTGKNGKPMKATAQLWF